MKPEEIEARTAAFNLKARKYQREGYRQMLAWVLLIGGAAWLLWRFFPAVALAVFVVLLFSGLVLYLVWKGWIDNRVIVKSGV